VGARPIASIVLAAGKGTRMRSDSKHKVCFEVGGVPVILRALRAYEECGITHHVIVVGDRAEQAISDAGRCFSAAAFAYECECASGREGRQVRASAGQLLEHGRSDPDGWSW